MNFNKKVRHINCVDSDGNPSGGAVFGTGIEINWQDGPLGRECGTREPNGASVETLIVALVKRLEFFQDSKFKCRENALAITKLEEALMWLNYRTQRRELAGTEGTNEGS